MVAKFIKPCKNFVRFPLSGHKEIAYLNKEGSLQKKPRGVF